jgi:hypothetical protein
MAHQMTLQTGRGIRTNVFHRDVVADGCFRVIESSESRLCRTVPSGDIGRHDPSDSLTRRAFGCLDEAGWIAGV